MTAERHVRAQGIVNRDRPREQREGPSDGTFGAQWCTPLVEALSWAPPPAGLGAGMRGEEPLSLRGL